MPWSLAMISTLLLRITPTQLYVVPRSMPMAGPLPALEDMAREEERRGRKSYVRESLSKEL